MFIHTCDLAKSCPPGVPGLAPPPYELPSQRWLWEPESAQIKKSQLWASPKHPMPQVTGGRMFHAEAAPSPRSLGPARSRGAETQRAHTSFRTWHLHLTSFYSKCSSCLPFLALRPVQQMLLETKINKDKNKIKCMCPLAQQFCF